MAAPGSDLAMSRPAFMEALASHLCLPSPAVMTCNEVFFDTLRTRHDTVKQHIVSEALLAKVHNDCEVYGLFSHLLPAVLQEDGGELQWGRACQGLVPHFKFLLTSPQGPQSFLSELKCVNASKSWYP